MINLMLGDCLERMKEIESASVDLIIADPPYGTTACKWDSVIDLSLMWEQLKRVIKPNGAIVLFGGQPFTSVLVTSNLLMYKYSWVWEKNRCGNFMAAKYKPLKFTEDIIVFGYGAVNTKGGKGGGKTERPYLKYNPQGVDNTEKTIKREKALPTDGINVYNKLSNKEFKSNGSNYPKDIIKFNCERGLHPTQKPVALMEYLIKTYSNEGEIVLDFTMGSGTTGVACVNTGRSFIGIEMGEEYFNIATKRINEAKEKANEN